VSYQWQLCTASHRNRIPHASSLTLALQPKDTGKHVRLVATATLSGQTAVTTSKRIAIRRRP
jgi:hypothetical protein